MSVLMDEAFVGRVLDLERRTATLELISNNQVSGTPGPPGPPGSAGPIDGGDFGTGGGMLFGVDGGAFSDAMDGTPVDGATFTTVYSGPGTDGGFF